MSSTPIFRSSRTWLAAIAIAGLASAVGACGTSTPKAPDETAQKVAAPAAATPASDENAPLPPPAYETGLPESVRAVLSTPFTGDFDADDQAAAHPRGRHVQPHVLLRRQGRAARRGVRVRQGLRGPAEQEAQDGQHQGQRRLRADAARRAGFGAHRRQGRPRDRPGHRQAGAAGARGLHQPHAHERERGGGDRPRRPGDRLGRRPVRAGGLRAQGQQLLREPRRAERRS